MPHKRLHYAIENVLLLQQYISNPTLFKKMKIRKLTSLLLLLCPLWVQAQTFTLEQSLRLAQANYPAVSQYGLIEQTREFNLSNVAKDWLPRLSVSANIYGFTDLLDESEESLASNFDMRNYLGSASLTLSQKVYDGGAALAQKRVLSSQADVDKRRLDVTMYELNERVEQIYFSILLLDEKIKQNGFLREDLDISFQNVESMIRGGLACQSDLDAVSLERQKALQQLSSLETSREAFLRMLGVFTGVEITKSATLVRPEMPLESVRSDGSLRPEMAFYASQSKLLEDQRKQLDTRLRPTLNFMGGGMIHNQVTKLLNRGLLFGGLSLSWNFSAFYTRKNDLRKLSVNELEIASNAETFLFNVRLQNEQADGVVSGLREQILRDDEILRLTESIRSKSEKQVELGTKNVNDLLQDVNAVSLARSNKALHEIELLQEIYSQKNINNR